jgi:hypothetical protein
MMKQSQSTSSPAGGFTLLGKTFLFGALADWVCAIPLLCFPGLLFDRGLPRPENTVYVRLIGLMLIVFGLFYLITATNPARYLGQVGVAILGRILGSIFYLIYLLFFHGEGIFWLFFILNLFCAFLHSWALGPGGWSRLGGALTGRDQEPIAAPAPVPGNGPPAA